MHEKKHKLGADSLADVGKECVWMLFLSGLFDV